MITADDGWIGQDNGSTGAGWNGAIQAMAYLELRALRPEHRDAASVEGGVDGALALGLWVMNQSAVSTEPPDEIGAADGTGHTGTSVTTGNPEWNDGSAAAPGPTRTFSPIPFMKRGQ